MNGEDATYCPTMAWKATIGFRQRAPLEHEMFAEGRPIKSCQRPLGPELAVERFKELRFDASDGVWRVAFAFDPERKAILLVAGDKSGVAEKRFYRQLIGTADARFDTHLMDLVK